MDARLDPVWGQGAVGTPSLREIELQTGELLSCLGSTTRAERVHGRCLERVPSLGKLNVELASYFRSLWPRYRTRMLSYSFVSAREREQRAYGLIDMCDAIVSSHEEGILKPDPRSYRIVCDRLEVDPTEVLFLDS